MKLRFATLFLAAAALLLSACSSIPSRIRANQSAFDAVTPEQQSLIREGKISLHFTKPMVLMALGEPDRVSVRADGTGLSEIWIYEGYRESRWYYDEPSFGFSSHYRSYGPSGYYPRPPLLRTSSNRSSKDLIRVSFRDGKVIAYEAPRR